jgi:hypothetical protein
MNKWNSGNKEAAQKLDGHGYNMKVINKIYC